MERMAEETRTARRLAAILAADVVGYSRLMSEDDEGTLAALMSHRKELIDPLIAQHQGRIVKTTGDGLLIEFASIVDAVRCAVVAQQGMAERNAHIDESRRIRFRVGINVGVARPVHVYRIETRVTPKTDTRGAAERAMLELPERPSIAVLPFTNMGGDREQDYFADGMVEDIITGLARIKWLFVIARNSSFAYKGRSVDVKQVGRELGVRYVLEGSVRKASNRVRVTGQVVEAENGRHIWADRWDRTLEDVFAIQDELTMSVVAAIEPNLRRAEIERVKRKRPDNLDAYDLVLRAIPDVYPAMPDGAAKALPLLERALAAEPDYALAHGFAAWCHEILFVRAGTREGNRVGAARHAHAAIGHGRDDAIALSLGAFALGTVGQDRDGARQAFEAALAVSPSCALTYIFGSVVTVLGGDADRAIEWGERALRLSPIDPMAYAPWFAIALARIGRGEHEAAAEAAGKVFQANPYWSNAHFLLAATHAKLGRLDAAKSAAARVLELQPGFSTSGVCTAYDMHGSIAVPLREALEIAGLPA
jgi:adenylate cyclase